MPDWTSYVRARLRLGDARPQHEQEVIDDLAAQLDDAYRDALARGLPDADAVAAATAHVGDWAALSRQVEESGRVTASTLDRLEVRAGDAAAAGNRHAGLVAGLLHDVRFAVRLAKRAPGFTAIAVLMLALGIGANTTIFGWINSILLDPLPGADARRMVDIDTQTKSGSHTSVSYPDFMDLRAATPALDGFVVHDISSASLADASGAERIWVEIVSDNFFDVLGVVPAAGRGFELAEGRAAIPSVVISERLARRRFGEPARAIGQSINLNSRPFTIVGVAPARFASGYTGLLMDVWLPVPMADVVMPGGNRTALRNNQWLDPMARLAPNVTLTQGSTALTEAASRIAIANGGTGDGRITVIPLWRSTHGAQSVLGPVLLVLMAMVAVVLLIACANLANLLLSRAAARRREFAVRLSLGCSRSRLIRQLLTEALLLVSVAGVAAMFAQVWTGGLLTAFMPPNDLPIALSAHTDWRVTIFTAIVAFASAVIFGLAPAVHAGRTDLVAFLKNEAGQAGGRRSWLRNTLVVSQMAFCLLLLASAGLFVRSLQNARLFDAGFKTDHVLLGSVDLFSAGYDRARGMQTLARILDDVLCPAWNPPASRGVCRSAFHLAAVPRRSNPKATSRRKTNRHGRTSIGWRRTTSERWGFPWSQATSTALRIDPTRPRSSSSTARSRIATGPGRTRSANAFGMARTGTP